MKTVTKTQPARISAEDIQSTARQGVERALAARQSMVELSQQHAEAVGGGLISLEALKLIGPIRGGGMIGPNDMFGDARLNMQPSR